MEDFHKTAVDILANDSNDQRLIFPPTYVQHWAWNGVPAQLHAWQARWVKIGPLSANKGMQMQIESFSNSSKLLFSLEGSWQSSDTVRKVKSGSDCAWKWPSVWQDVKKQRDKPLRPFRVHYLTLAANYESVVFIVKRPSGTVAFWSFKHTAPELARKILFKIDMAYFLAAVNPHNNSVEFYTSLGQVFHFRCGRRTHKTTPSTTKASGIEFNQ